MANPEDVRTSPSPSPSESAPSPSPQQPPAGFVPVAALKGERQNTADAREQRNRYRRELAACQEAFDRMKQFLENRGFAVSPTGEISAVIGGVHERRPAE